MRIFCTYNKGVNFGWQRAFVRELQLLGNVIVPDPFNADISLVFEPSQPKPLLKPVVVYVFNYPRNFPNDPFFEAIKRANLLVFGSEVLLEKTRELFLAKSISFPPAEVVYTGVDDRIACKYKSTDGEYFLWVGNMVERKRVDLLAKYMKELNLPMVFIGSGPEFEKVKKIYPDAIYCGSLDGDEKFRWIAGCKALVSFSRDETFFLPAIEAGFYEKPVVVGESWALRTIYENTLLFCHNEMEFKDKVPAIDKFKYKGKELRRLMEKKELFVTVQGCRLNNILHEYFG